MRTKIYFHFLLFAYASLFLLGISDNLRGPIYSDILKTFSVDPVQGSMFFSVTSICAFAGGFVTAKLIRRFSHYAVLQASIFLCSASLLLMSFANSFYFLMFGTALLGVSYGWMGVVQNILVARFAPHQRKQQWLTGLHTVYAGSALLAPSLIAYLFERVQASGGPSVWRTGLQAGASFGFVIFASAWWVFHTRRDQLVLKHITENNHETAGVEIVAGNGSGFSLRLLFAVGLSLYVVGEIIVASRLASFAEQVWQTTAATASLWTTGFFLGMFVSRFYFSVRPTKTALHKFVLLCLVLSFISVLVGICVHPVALIVSGLLMGPFYPTMMVWAEQNFHDQLEDAMGLGIAFSSFLLVFSQTAYGYLTKSYGQTAGYWLAPMSLLVSMIVLLILFKRLSVSISKK